MRKRSSLRRLTVAPDTVCLWSLRHRHTDGEACRDVLTLILDGVRTRLVFVTGEGRAVGGGYLPSGLAVDEEGRYLNLHEPGVVAAFVDEAARRGLLAEGGAYDGWELFEAVAVSRAAPPPAVPPDSPAGR
ncbi:hypothetical protein [Streptomyces sp. bgisy153]|uniref:hypothetical protein n=1 Tax=Streptomyces sp. bgisy153 TaxID=3413793 RepID=UPI003D71D45F